MGGDFEGFLIVEDNRQFRRPDERDCRAVQQTYGLTNLKVLYDPNGTLESLGLGARHTHFVLREGSVVEFRQANRDDGFAPVIEQLIR
ncbi:MAG: hypothetical protein AAFU79_02700 [Myxococcota bacterium]